MDEICNKTYFLDDKISNCVTEFFLNNEDFIFLKGVNNLRIEIPIVAYNQCDNLFELNHYKHALNKSKKMYDLLHINKEYVIRYAIFLNPDNYIFNKEHQYEIEYKCKPLSIHN